VNIPSVWAGWRPAPEKVYQVKVSLKTRDLLDYTERFMNLKESFARYLALYP
jgi:hypothetical protein